MRSTSFALLLAGLASAAGASVATAQKPAPSETGFTVGYTDIGPVIGFGNVGSAGITFGGRFERGIKALPSLANGVLGIELSASYYHYSSDFLTVNYGFTVIPIGATANYHIHLDNKKFDPFVGAGVGYSIVSTTFGGSSGGGFYFIGRGGLRYFVSSKLALYGDVGAGAATVNLGAMFRLK